MNTTLVKALAALMPIGGLFSWSIASYIRDKTIPSFLQAVGAGCLVVVVLTHVA